MALGQIRVEFDPVGYYRSTESGWEWEITGDELASRTAPPSAVGLQRLPFLKESDNFWNPPNSQWLLCRPAQFEPTFYKTDQLAEQIVGKAFWTPCTGLDAANILETEPTNLGGGTYPDNKWLSFVAPEALGTQPISVNFTNLASAAGTTFEASTGVLLATGGLPNYFSPFFQFVQHPDPQDQVIFGFGDLCFIFNEFGIRLMRTPSNDHQTWELLRRWGKNNPIGGRARFHDVMSVSAGVGGASTIHVYQQVRSMFVALVGLDSLFVGGENTGETFQLRHTERNGNGLQYRGGPWWLAGFPRQKFYCQTQVVRYGAAEHAVTADPTDVSVTYFDLGENYTPIESPEVRADFVMHKTGDPDQTDLTAGLRLTAPGTGEVAEIQLIDDANDAWVSGLGRHKGALHIGLVPGNAVTAQGFGDTACTSPMLRRASVRFAPHQTARARTANANLTDDLWTTIVAETSLRDPLTKRITITLTDAGASVLAGLGVAHRSDFPINVTEDTAGDGSYSTVRLRGWVEAIEQEEVGLIDQDTTKPAAVYTVLCRGLTARLEKSPWLFLDTLVSTADNGELLHTEVPARVLLQSGWDVTDPTFVYIEEDTAEGKIPVLPGSDDDQGDGVGAKAHSPYAPEIDEEKATYIQRIAREWRGWLFWETLDGQIRYEPDPLILISEEGTTQLSIATLYKSDALATAAGRAGQVWLAESQERYIPPVANVVVVEGVDAEGHVLRHVMDRDEASITDITKPNFLGEPTRPVRYETKLGISEGALMQIARIALWRHRRSRIAHKWGCPLPPWGIGISGVRPGDIITAEGRGDWFVNHVRTELLGRGRGASGYVWRTVLDCETVPESEVA